MMMRMVFSVCGCGGEEWRNCTHMHSRTTMMRTERDRFWGEKTSLRVISIELMITGSWFCFYELIQIVTVLAVSTRDSDL